MSCRLKIFPLEDALTAGLNSKLCIGIFFNTVNYKIINLLQTKGVTYEYFTGIFWFYF